MPTADLTLVLEGLRRVEDRLNTLSTDVAKISGSPERLDALDARMRAAEGRLSVVTALGGIGTLLVGPAIGVAIHRLLGH